MYTDCLSLLGGQSVPVNSRNPVVCVLTADSKVIYVHDLLNIIGNSVSNVPTWFYF